MSLELVKPELEPFVERKARAERDIANILEREHCQLIVVELRRGGVTKEIRCEVVDAEPVVQE